MNLIPALDLEILHFIQNHIHHPMLDPIFLFLTRIGDYGIIWILFAVFLIAKKEFRKTGFMVLAALMLGLIFGEILLKPLFGRIRPFEAYDLFPTILDKTRGFSFPSGHTTSSFAAASILVYRSGKRAWIFLLLAVGIALSRLYYLVHYPSDIVGGILLGIACAGLVISVVQRTLRERS